MPRVVGSLISAVKIVIGTCARGTLCAQLLSDVRLEVETTTGRCSP